MYSRISFYAIAWKVVRNPSMRYANIVPTVSSSLRARLNVVQFIIVLLTFTSEGVKRWCY
jgi:hypothetical protein